MAKKRMSEATARQLWKMSAALNKEIAELKAEMKKLDAQAEEVWATQKELERSVRAWDDEDSKARLKVRKGGLG